MIANPFILVVGGIQIIGGLYSLYIGDWKMGIINISVGIANCVLSTVRG